MDRGEALARAVGLAAPAQRRSRPNPAVGCVLVRDGRVVGEGATDAAGGPHAEVAALAAAGASARGAIAHVTLEPCDHTGRTGPCSVALLEAGVGALVHALPDPSAVASGGAARLAAAGVPVRAGDPGGWAAALSEVFLRHVATGLPTLDLKLAVTPAGAVTAGDGRWVTGPVARRRVHRLRGDADAVLVGVGTVLADDPSLDVRHVAPTDAGQPRPVVLDSGLRTPPEATVVRRGGIVVAAGPRADGRRADRLRAAGATVEVVDAGPDGRVDPGAALRRLADAHDVRVVLAEPGTTLGGALLAAGLVRRTLLHVGGAAGAPAPTAVPARPLDLRGWRRTGALRLGDDVEVRLERSSDVAA